MEVLSMHKKQSILIVTVSLFFILGFTTQSIAAWFGTKELDTEKIAVAFARQVESGGYNIVSTEELKKWIDEKKDMLIVDTMPYKDSYKKQHIPGAVQFEFPIPVMNEIEEKKKADFIKLLGSDKNRLIVIYCGFTKCTRSHNGAMWAVKFGYKNVYRYPGGIKAWTEADYPVEK
jgi:rhodanese-related sulfurtransferase